MDSKHSDKAPPNISFQTENRPDGVRVLKLAGRLDTRTCAWLWPRALKAMDPLSAPVELDAAGVEYCSGAGIGLLVDLRRHRLAEGVAALEIRGLAPAFQSILDGFNPAEFPALPPESGFRSVNLPEETGRAFMAFIKDLRELIGFTGELCVALLTAVFHPRKVRWRDALNAAENCGVNGLPIISLIGFLIGLIMAFQAAIPLKQFAAVHLVANMIALSMLRELGALMTAIILAGRTGSAFAAELGTMKINEEIDALKTMGLDPVSFLVVPRVLAAVVMTPLMTLYANLMGLIGGALVVMAMGYPFVTYVHQVQSAVGLTDFVGGQTKAFVFGVLVAGIGCLRGLQTKSGASAVGYSTTRAVVSGIVLIAIADGVFAVVYYYLGI